MELRRWIAVLAAVLLLAAVTAGAEEPYAPVLAQYAAGLAGDEAAREAREAVWNAWMCAMYMPGSPAENVGYALPDLDGDGSPELVIGTVSEREPAEDLIFEILTLKDGVPVTVLRGWERFRVSLTRDPDTGVFGFYAEGSSGASNSVWQHASAMQGLDAWATAETLEAEWDLDTGVAVWTLNGAEIPGAQGPVLVETWGQNLWQPEMRPFAE